MLSRRMPTICTISLFSISDNLSSQQPSGVEGEVFPASSRSHSYWRHIPMMMTTILNMKNATEDCPG